ncbi:3-oxoadipate enol-lactonase [Paracoccaceae bacterium GXU_MW_L88]
MKAISRDWGAMHYREDGPADAPVILAINSLGTDLRMWDSVVDALPDYRFLRYDKRGHGVSDAPEGAYTMAGLTEDAAALLDHLNIKNAVILGCSIGGMIAQKLAATRPELCRALILSNTAAKIGTPEMWAERIDQVHTDGLAAMAPGIMERWFSPDFVNGNHHQLWSNMLSRQSPAGYAGCGHAISGADLTESTQKLDLPVMLIAGGHDGSTPPDLVQSTADLISGSQYKLIDETGHIPAIEAPEKVAAFVTTFIKELPNV